MIRLNYSIHNEIKNTALLVLFFFTLNFSSEAQEIQIFFDNKQIKGSEIEQYFRPIKVELKAKNKDYLLESAKIFVYRSDTLFEIREIQNGNNWIREDNSIFPIVKGTAYKFEVKKIRNKHNNEVENIKFSKTIILNGLMYSAATPPKKEFKKANKNNHGFNVYSVTDKLNGIKASIKDINKLYVHSTDGTEIINCEVMLVRGKRPVSKTIYSQGEINLERLLRGARKGDYILIHRVKTRKEKYYSGKMYFLLP